MSEPFRTEPSSAAQGAADVDRDAKIEQLLLIGLDRYFAGDYEDAINVWTRALFLDRSHARARAYIERARSALAEQQRETDEVLQTGLAAFDRGDADEARRLLRTAINRGAPKDEALSVLDRLDRLEQGAGPNARTRTAREHPTPQHEGDGRSLLFAGAIYWGVAVLIFAIAGALVVFWSPAEWTDLFRPGDEVVSAAAPPAQAPAALPVPRRGDTALARARGLAATGHLRDALAALDLVRPTDPEKPEADRLRADIQRQLIQIHTSTTPSVLPPIGPVSR